MIKKIELVQSPVLFWRSTLDPVQDNQEKACHAKAPERKVALPVDWNKSGTDNIEAVISSS